VLAAAIEANLLGILRVKATLPGIEIVDLRA
jgi:hypothetical protein